MHSTSGLKQPSCPKWPVETAFNFTVAATFFFGCRALVHESDRFAKISLVCGLASICLFKVESYLDRSIKDLQLSIKLNDESKQSSNDPHTKQSNASRVYQRVSRKLQPTSSTNQTQTSITYPSAN